MLEDYDDDEELLEVDERLLRRLAREEAEARPPVIGKNRVWWPLWLRITDCRVLTDMGGLHGIEWVRATTVLRDWCGAELSVELHGALRRIAGEVMRVERATRDAKKRSSDG